MQNPETIDVMLHIPIVDHTTAIAALVVRASVMLDEAKKYIEKPETQIDASHGDELLYIEGAHGVIDQIRRRACEKATQAFIEEFTSDQTMQDLRTIHQEVGREET